MTSEPLEEPRPLGYSFWLGALILRGSITPRVMKDVIKFGVIAEAIVLLSIYIEQRWDTSIAIPHGPFSAAGAVLGILLVLRTNAGYDRWWEARKLWGGIVNQSRNLGIAGLAYGPSEAKWRSEFILWTAAFPHVIRCHLRDERSIPEVGQLIGHKQAMKIAEAKHMPTFVAMTLAEMLHEARKHGMGRYAFLQADQQRCSLVDHLGGCERIRNTPLARSSAILVRQFIFVFLVSLPLASLNDFDDMQLLSSLLSVSISDNVVLIPLWIMLLSVPLLSLDRIGMELQNPFDVRRMDHLPIDAICKTIERNLLELLRNDPASAEEGLIRDSLEISPELAARLENQSNIRDTRYS